MDLTKLKLSITEEFVALSLLSKEIKETIRIGNNKIYAISAALIELFLDDKIIINEKKEVIVLNSDTTGKEFIDLILMTLTNKKPMKLLTWIEYFYTNSKLCNNFYNAVIQNIITMNILEVENSENEIFSNKQKYKDTYNICDSIIKKIRAELLEEERISENTLYLVLLLDGNKMLKYYFSKYEYKTIKPKIKQLYKSKEFEKFNIIKDAINNIEISSFFTLLLGMV